MQDRVKDADVFFNDIRQKSTSPTIPLNQELPLLGIQPGSFTIQIDDDNPETPPVNLMIELNGLENLTEIIKKINDKAIEQMNYQKSEYFPTGYDALLFAEISSDNHVYLEPKVNYQIKFDTEGAEETKDTTGFLELMKFQSLNPILPGAEGVEATTLQPAGPVPLDKSEYEAVFNGYSKEKYVVRVIRGGTYEDARYIVSDDEGKTWSQPQVLQKHNEILNPDGKANNKVSLSFNIPGKPIFDQGLELKFEGNEYVEYQGNHQIKNVLLDNGIKVALNITANELFFKNDKDINSINTFEILNRFIESLETDDQTAILKSIEDIDRSINQVLYRRGQVGSIFKELESSEDRIEQNIDFKSDELSNIEDMDLAKGATDLNQAELKHKVALDSTARLIQPTLINFLK